MPTMRKPRDIELGLLGGDPPAGSANPPAGSQPPPFPPPLQHIEQRGVSAAFLTQLTASRLTEAMKREATADAVAFLKTKIAGVEEEIEQERARVARAKNPQPESEPEPEPEQSEPEPGAGLSRYMSRQMTALEYSKQNVIGMLERALRQHEKDLDKRESEPYLTSRDVHKLLVVAQTKERMCRYLELPDVHGGQDEAGRTWVGAAQYFFSYSWDSPWDSVVSALEAHTERAVAAGEPPPYYWIDIFACNQHLSLWPWKCTGAGLAGGCPGCKAAHPKSPTSDMHDWDTADPNHLKGFERVIAHTRHTLVLNEPWDSPRPPTRVWCLFEGYQTLSRGGKLEVVLDKAAQQELQLSLGSRFGGLQGIVGRIDARMADATMPADRDKIFGAIEQLPGGFGGLNEKMQGAQQLWLCETAELVIERTDPWRARLDEAAMALEVADIGDRWWRQLRLERVLLILPVIVIHDGGAKLTALLERLPRLAPLMKLLGALMMAAVFANYIAVTLGLLPSWDRAGSGILEQIDSGWIWNLDSGNTSWLWGQADLVFIFGGLILWWVGGDLTEHQANRQLRQPPTYGDWATRNQEGIGEAMFVLGMLVLACLWYAVGWQLMVSVYMPIGLVALAVFAPLPAAREAAARRASLRAWAGWLRLRLGDAEGAAARLGEAQAELLSAVGPDDELSSWVPMAGQCRALCDAGREAEAEVVRAQITGQTGRVWSLLNAGVAAAARAPDAEVLKLLEKAAHYKCWVPAGSRPMNRNRTEGGLPEWDEFLGRMAASSDADGRGGRGGDAADDDALKVELLGMNARALMKRAEAMGIDEQRLERADDATDRKQALVDLIMQESRRRTQGAVAEIPVRWEAYCATTIELARTKVAELNDEITWSKYLLAMAEDSNKRVADCKDLSNALESRGLPKEVSHGESEEAKRVRLLASLFEHPAYDSFAAPAALERTSTQTNAGMSEDEALQAALVASMSPPLH
eukprot:COSAG06_NODE_3232_length_5642_cov_6.207108_3_plen_978_part_00